MLSSTKLSNSRITGKCSPMLRMTCLIYFTKCWSMIQNSELQSMRYVLCKHDIIFCRLYNIPSSQIFPQKRLLRIFPTGYNSTLPSSLLRQQTQINSHFHLNRRMGIVVFLFLIPFHPIIRAQSPRTRSPRYCQIDG